MYHVAQKASRLLKIDDTCIHLDTKPQRDGRREG